MSAKPSFSRGSICAVYGCNNYKQQKDPKSFFRTHKVLDILKQRIVACKRTDPDHFDVECFRNKNLCSQGLVPGLVPTLKLYNKKNTMRRCLGETNLDCSISSKQIKLNLVDPIIETQEHHESIVANLQTETLNLHLVIDNYKKRLNNYSSL